jgi:hypothetical protein
VGFLLLYQRDRALALKTLLAFGAYVYVSSCNIAWWGGAAFAPHVLEMVSLKRIHARLVFGEECVHDEDRKRLAERLREEIGQIFEPVVSEEQG